MLKSRRERERGGGRGGTLGMRGGNKGEQSQRDLGDRLFLSLATPSRRDGDDTYLPA